MFHRLRELYVKSTLAAKIRISYFLVIAPMLFFAIAFILVERINNVKFQTMVESVATASEFNLDFKKDFDYETYLLIVGNKTIEESEMGLLLDQAEAVVAQLEETNADITGHDELKTVKKYLSNLKHYKEQIEQNLIEGDKYEENMMIWENDVQIVTSLLREEFVSYTYSEAQKLQQWRTEYQTLAGRIVIIGTILLMILLGILAWVSYYIPLTITSPIEELGKVTDQIAKGDLSVRSDIDGGPEVTALSDSLNSMIDRINELLDQITKEQVRLRKAEFQLLQSQINPHFLYNTLDAIIWLAESGEQKEVVSMVRSLSDFFRTSLNQGRDIIPLKEELSHVRSYLAIQQVRYRDILSYEIAVPESLSPYLIPKITIQPLVENALYHGIKNRRGGGMIHIRAEQFDDFFLLEVIDDGAGMDKERLADVRHGILHRKKDDNEFFGLYNVNERIRLHFGEDYGISIDSEAGAGTTTRIRLPYRVSNNSV
ncbi:MAG: sensor histidine kinase [Lachnospiraceae bacterium]|nr:sensor histidine kinase [Lachnospiraceae bacterium]